MRTRIVIAALSAALVIAVAVPLIANGARGEGTKTLSSTMSGKREVGPDGRKNAGDRNGLGGFTAVIDSGQLCFGITVRNIDRPVGAHIHRGGPSRAGDIVLALAEPEEGDPGASAGCVPVEEPLARSLLRRPGRFYVNVHTESFPGGAVRGQLKTQKR